MIVKISLIVSILSFSLLSYAVDTPRGGDSPDAPNRTNAQNYKDKMLATCIAAAYKNDPNAIKDSSATASVLLEWTYYDMEDSGEAMNNLINKYLKRDYRNPLEGYEGVKFDLLKCLDMYHSKELDLQVKKYVLHPNKKGR